MSYAVFKDGVFWKRVTICSIFCIFVLVLQGSAGTLPPDVLEAEKNSLEKLLGSEGCTEMDVAREKLGLSDFEFRQVAMGLQKEQKNVTLGLETRSVPKISGYDCGLDLTRSNVVTEEDMSYDQD